jgi:hypothetical protein
MRDIAAACRTLVLRLRSVRVADAGRSAWVIGPLGALWAAGIGLAIAVLSLVLVWVATPGSGLSLTASIRVAGLLWGVAHGAPVAIGAVTYSLLPWGLALVPVLLLGYAGGWSARRASVSSVRDLVVLVGSAVTTYAMVAGVVAQFSARPESSISLSWAVAQAAALAVLAFGWGAWRASRGAIAGMVPWWLTVSLRTGGIGALAVLGFGAVGAAAAMIVRVDDSITMAQSLHAGVWGGLALLLLGIAYVPVAIVWSSAYLVGAGFIIGPGVAVSPFIPVTSPTQLPPFPMLAAVPQSATPLAWALPVAGVVAGVLVGLAIARSCRQEARLTRLVLAFAAAAVSGVALMVVTFLANGALGDVRLAHLGPSASTVGVLVFVLILLGAVPSAVAPSPPAKPQLAVAEAHDVATTSEGAVMADGDSSDREAAQDSAPE